jgi:transcription antitermination factor NusG
MRRSKLKWYVLKVKCGEELVCAERLRSQFPEGDYDFRVPQKQVFQRNGGKESYILKASFTGHVFVMTEQSPFEARLAMRKQYMQSNDIFGMLHYGDDEGDVVLHSADKLLIEHIYNDDFVAETIKAIKVGDYVEVTDTMFEGFGGVVKRMNKSKRKAEIEFDLFGKKHVEVFAIEFVELAEV